MTGRVRTWSIALAAAQLPGGEVRRAAAPRSPAPRAAVAPGIRARADPALPGHGAAVRRHGRPVVDGGAAWSRRRVSGLSADAKGVVDPDEPAAQKRA